MDLASPSPSAGAEHGAQATAAWAARTSYGRLLALLASADGDIGAAEDALADAFERALVAWPRDGVPDRPEAWLLTVGRNRLRDHWKSAATRTRAALEGAAHVAAPLDEVDPDAIGDRRLELLLVCAHPAIDPAVRMPLMLNVVLGLPAKRIATALALPAPTLAARLVRAKRRIKAAGVPFQVPDRSVLHQRVDHVLEAIYGAYATDWAIAGREQRGTLADEALYLAETLAEMLPHHAEVRGLVALLYLSMARAPARTDADGGLVPLAAQDPALWDTAMIDRGRDHLRAAHARGDLGRYQLEAAIQAVHSARRERGSTDWASLRDLHTSLHVLAPTLGGTTALAAATAETDGPEAGLALLDAMGPGAGRFQPAWATRASLLARLGRQAEAVAAYDRAISLTTDPAARAHLEREREAASAGRAPRCLPRRSDLAPS